MNRVVLDTNVVVSAMLVPSGTQAAVLLLALRSIIRLYLSEPVFGEYSDVLHRPRLKIDPRKISVFLRNIRTVARFVRPSNKLSISPDESDNRLLECAEAAKANYLVTGNIRHFPPIYKMTKVVTGRQFLDLLATQSGR
jgi:putative PIN family toxin of toxin-antitoxin system